MLWEELIVFLDLRVIRPKKNNCVVRVTAEKTLGRVGRYFFSCDGSHAGRKIKWLSS